ncbi:hypothetical protein HZ326_6442 [Fusarium oxysporum f. sp. albedinis]|nr:hypothetical protein HZ326_6442 [Fusarium oxysporum f. sp. albedinis]
MPDTHHVTDALVTFESASVSLAKPSPAHQLTPAFFLRQPQHRGTTRRGAHHHQLRKSSPTYHCHRSTNLALH